MAGFSYLVVERDPLGGGLLAGTEVARSKSLQGAVDRYVEALRSSSRPGSLRLIREADGARHHPTVPDMEALAAAIQQPTRAVSV